jgi:hypothetical protein
MRFNVTKFNEEFMGTLEQFKNKKFQEQMSLLS